MTDLPATPPHLTIPSPRPAVLGPPPTVSHSDPAAPGPGPAVPGPGPAARGSGRAGVSSDPTASGPGCAFPSWGPVDPAAKSATQGVEATEEADTPARLGAVEHRNDVRLVGRVVAAPAGRALPDGELITSWRIAIERPPERRGPLVTCDAVTCATGDPSVRNVVTSFRCGDTVEVIGGLRRRAWRTVTGVVNFYEVEVYQARIVSAAIPRQPPPALPS